MNVVLTGFMGTGKSIVGRAVAGTLGLTFVDMDEVIAQRAGMAVAEIFARLGEDAFRDMESALARELAARDGLIIATGGGTLLRPENRSALGASGVIVGLSCSAEEIVRRLAGDQTRPLLAAPDKERRIGELLAARAPVYDSLPVVIDTTGRTIAEVAAAVAQAYKEQTCRLST